MMIDRISAKKEKEKKKSVINLWIIQINMIIYVV